MLVVVGLGERPRRHALAQAHEREAPVLEALQQPPDEPPLDGVGLQQHERALRERAVVLDGARRRRAQASRRRREGAR